MDQSEAQYLAVKRACESYSVDDVRQALAAASFCGDAVAAANFQRIIAERTAGV